MFINRFISLVLLLITIMLSDFSIAGPGEHSNNSEYQFFSVEEANKLLPDVEVCMNAISNLKGEAAHINKEELSPDELQMNEENMNANMNHINKLMRRLEDAGVILRHMKVGLVDFPHMRKGRVVFLCWQAGENKIRYWHEINGGKAGRKPLYF